MTLAADKKLSVAKMYMFYFKMATDKVLYQITY